MSGSNCLNIGERDRNVMKRWMIAIMSIALSATLIGCTGNQDELTSQVETLLIENEQLSQKVEKLTNNLDNQNEQLVTLENTIAQLEEEKERLELSEHEIRYDLRVPVAFFEHIQQYSQAIRNQDEELLDLVVPDTDSHPYLLAQHMIEQNKPMIIKYIQLLHESTYQYEDRVTDTKVIRVLYDDTNGAFAFQNTNDAGWRFVDID